jgi:preprotein translocase subunit SecE
LQVRFLSALQVDIPMSAHERCNEVARKVIDEPSEEIVANARKDRAAKRGPFARIALFIRQVIGELKKVVTPTRKELLSYTGVVLVFVVIMMAIVSLLDWIFGLGVVWVFGNPK